MTEKTTRGKVATVRHSPMEHPRHQYPAETDALQGIALACGLAEEIKWGKPCFTSDGKNIALIQRFNSYIALMFFQGALLEDPEKLLCRVGERMQAPRQLRFTGVAEIHAMQRHIVSFLQQAIEVERTGARVQRVPPTDLALPAELVQRFAAQPELQRAFAALTPGRQKGYIFQIGAAKQARTREARIDKYSAQILAGKGWNE